MKKIYSLIALMLMCFVGSVQAQHKWEVTGGNVPEGGLVAGEGHNYVIQQGDGTLGDGSTCVHDHDKYLSGLDYLSDGIIHESVWNFIETGEEMEGFKVYVLKNVSTQKFLGDWDKSHLVTSVDEAFRFTARKGVAISEDALLIDVSPWSEYSNAVSETRSTKAQELGGWVFASPSSMTYMCYYRNPAFAQYIDTNNWFVYPVEEQSMNAYEKFSAIYDQYFANGFALENYSVGTNPGCVNQAFFDKMQALYAEATTARENASTPAKECDRLRVAIINLFEVEMPKNLIALTSGYYVIKNVGGRGFLTVTDNGAMGRGKRTLASLNVVEGTDYDNWSPESVYSWDINHAQYIWSVEAVPNENGKWYFKNFKTGKYLSADESFAMSEVPNNALEVIHYSGTEFYTMTVDGMMHVSNQGEHTLMIYNVKDDPGSRFIYYPISKEIIDNLNSGVEESKYNEELQNLVQKTKSDFQYVNYAEGDFYKHPDDAGLVTKVLEVNSMATKEGSLEALFDADMSTYFHTAWNDADVEAQGTEGRHWMKLDLGKEVQELVVKFTKRHTYNSHVSKYALYTTSDGNPDNADWNELIATSADSIEYQYANNTHIATYKFATPVRYVRFEVLKTRGMHLPMYDKMTAGTGPFWHMSEFRCYDKADLMSDPSYSNVPNNIKDLLRSAYQEAVAEVEAHAATKTTITKLQQAVKIFLEACSSSNTLAINNVLTGAGKQFVLPIEMVNADEITGIQFDLYLPEGFTVAKDEYGMEMIDIAGRSTSKKHSVACKMQEDGALRVVCSSTTNKVFAGTEGAVLNVTLNVDASAKDGNYEICLRKIVLASPKMNRYTTPEVKANVTIKSFTLGDVNNDQIIDVTDVAGVVNCILGSSTESLVREAADVNVDGIIDVTDVAGVVNIVLSGKGIPSMLTKPMKSTKAVRNEKINLEVLPFSLKAGEEKEVSVLMNNPGDAFTGIQFDLYLPEGVTVLSDEDGYYVEIGSRSSGRRHTVECALQTDGAVRVLAYSGSNKTFKEESGDILVMTLCGAKDLKEQVSELQIKNIVLARPNVTNYKPVNYNATVVSGNPVVKDVTLSGHYTEAAAKEISAALSGKGVTSVSLEGAFVDENVSFTTGNPNTLYYVSNDIKLGNAQNVVSENNCAKLVLTDGYDFNAKQSFTAAAAEFTRSAVAGWSSVCLPYAAEIPADLSVEQFTGLEGDKANFEKAAAMEANVPYIFKANGDVKFAAANVEVAATPAAGKGIFVGTFSEVPAAEAAGKFVLNNDGAGFSKCQAGVAAFNAYLSSDAAVETIAINHGDITGIEGVGAEEAMFPADVYTMDGKLVKKNAQNLNGLAQGLYIVNGVKVVK